MPGKVTLTATAGPIQGRRFEFTEHDTFLFGRAPDCHAELPSGDTSASRHHFLLEVAPPLARLRDLGSLNGTHVNGVRHGGRQPGETPEQAARRPFPQVDLRHGDQVRVGTTVFGVTIEREGADSAPTDPSLSFDVLVEPVSEAPVVEAVSAVAAELPERVGDYALGPLLGRGGMGVVHRARRLADGTVVAVKLMLPQVLVSAAARDAFLREVEVTRSLRHPRIVELLDCGYAAERFWFAMEYCPGGSALALLRACGGRVPLERALDLADGALDGLGFAHAQGVVHRDVKPDNLLLAADGTARVTDFGLAKSFSSAGLSGLTATGTVAGTLYYMPREQLTSFRLLRPASDVWSLAATLYHLLTGEYARDFAAGRDPLAVILKGGTIPIRDREPRVSVAVAEVIDRALADDVATRYADAARFRDALRAARARA